MDATLSSNIFIVLLVTAVLSGLVVEESSPSTAGIDNQSMNTLITQKIFRQCGNSLGSNSACVKLVDDLVQGLITKDEFLYQITHTGINNADQSKLTISNSL